MSLFVLDTVGDKQLLKNTPKVAKSKRLALLKEKRSVETITQPTCNNAADEDEVDDGDYFGLPPPNVDLSKLINSTLELTKPAKSKVDEELEHASELVDTTVANATVNSKRRPRKIIDIDYSDFNALTGKFDEEQTLHKIDVEKELESSDLTGIEKLKEMPSLTKKAQRKLARLERDKTKGAGWFNLPATEKTEEIENDLKILQMRSVLDPKHFYKKNDLKVLPKYFQIGTVQHSPLDYYNERHIRRNKKHSLVDELMADAEVQKYTKRKYKEIIAVRDKYAHRKAMKKMKKLKKNK